MCQKVSYMECVKQFGVRTFGWKIGDTNSICGGLYLNGLRWVYLDRDEVSKTDKNLSFATTEYLQAAKPAAVLVLALRGAEATRRVESILGPRDPVLAKRTDPSSVRAELGVDRERNVALLVPSASGNPHASSSKELAWWFGGRLSPPSQTVANTALQLASLAGRASSPASQAGLAGWASHPRQLSSGQGWPGCANATLAG